MLSSLSSLILDKLCEVAAEQPELLEGDAGIFKNRERSERFTLFHALINYENTFPLHFLDKRGCCLVKGSQEKTAFFLNAWSSNMSSPVYAASGEIKKISVVPKEQTLFFFLLFYILWMFSKSLHVNAPFAEYLRSHGRKNTLLDGKRRSETLKGKDISFLKDVISLYSLPHCVVCHPVLQEINLMS